MTGKICIVTGANSGIGLETARGLAERGATVVLACRNRQKGAVALSDIEQTTGNENLHLFQVHLDQQKSIRSFASAFQQRFNRLDVLINNAGVFKPKREVTAEGYETTFATNHLAYFLLTHLLLDTLKATRGARIINVSSDAHQSGHINFTDLQSKKKYSGYKAYAHSKLANILFTFELSNRLELSSRQHETPDLLQSPNPTVNCLHPGVVATNIAGSFSNFFGFFFKMFSPFFLSPAKGAKTSLYLATSPQVGDVTGKYFDKCTEQVPSVTASNSDIAKRLYEVSAKLTGVSEIGNRVA